MLFVPEHEDLHTLPCEEPFIRNTLVLENPISTLYVRHVDRFLLLGVTELQVGRGYATYWKKNHSHSLSIR